MTVVIADVAATLIAAGVLGCLGYLRGISKKLENLTASNFSQDLHILDLDERVRRLEQIRRAHV